MRDRFPRSFVLVLLAILVCSSGATSSDFVISDETPRHGRRAGSVFSSTTTSVAPAPSISGMHFRILPVGDSITMGWGSHDGNGYRRMLQHALEESNTVEMVGRVEAGNMTDPFSDGYNGFTVQQIMSLIEPSFAYRPNVALIMAGINNFYQGVPDATTDMRKMINMIFDGVPGITILVATVPFTFDTSMEAHLVPFNQFLRDTVTSMANDGHKIAFVDLREGFYNRTGLHHNVFHPNDAGYRIMSEEWYKTLSSIISGTHWIQDPDSLEGIQFTNKELRKRCMTGKPRLIDQGQIFDGAVFGESIVPGTKCVANYWNKAVCNCIYPDATEAKVSLVGSSCETMTIQRLRLTQFADLNGDHLADIIQIGQRVVKFFLQSQEGAFIPSDSLALPDAAKLDQIQFADVSGDGRADMLWVKQNGSVEAWLNDGTGDNISFNFAGTILTGFSNMPGAGVHFWDLDGDGRADFCYIDVDGSVKSAYNTGTSTNIEWGRLFDFTSTEVSGARDSVAIGDIGGDGHADYFNINRSNALTTSLTFNPYLKKLVRPVKFNNVAMEDGSGIQYFDMNGDGRADMLLVDPETSSVNMWKNKCRALASNYNPGKPDDDYNI